MKWHGGRNSAPDETGEWSPSSGFSYLTYLSNFPGVFRGTHRVWAHEYSQPVQVAARLKIAEVRDWNCRKRSVRLQASCELIVDNLPALCVMPSAVVSSCAEAKRVASALLGNEDFIERGLRWFYSRTMGRLLDVEHNGSPYATLFAPHADWLLSPGYYHARLGLTHYLLHRSSGAVSWEPHRQAL